jgi:hypothetical protein
LALSILACLIAFKVTPLQPLQRLRWHFVPLLAIVLCACGGGSGNNPGGGGIPAGTYTLVVIALLGTTTQIQNLAR